MKLQNPIFDKKPRKTPSKRSSKASSTTSNHATAKIAIDPIIFTIHQNELKILLQKREKQPFKDKLELPGGLLLPNETATQTLKRKLKLLTGIKQNIFLKQFHTFTSPNRDPRQRTISIGFISLINENHITNFQDWHSYKEINNLAFDHKHIITSARDHLKSNTNPKLVKHFMPEFFPLNKLQKIYQILEESIYDNRNFRKKMISSKTVNETNQLETNVSHRPAKLFKFT